MDNLNDKESLNNRRWKHRRRMAYISLFSILITTYLILFIVPIEKIDKLNDLIIWFYISMSSIIGAYVGFSTFDDKWNKK